MLWMLTPQSSLGGGRYAYMEKPLIDCRSSFVSRASAESLFSGWTAHTSSSKPEWNESAILYISRVSFCFLFLFCFFLVIFATRESADYGTPACFSNMKCNQPTSNNINTIHLFHLSCYLPNVILHACIKNNWLNVCWHQMYTVICL